MTAFLRLYMEVNFRITIWNGKTGHVPYNRISRKRPSEAIRSNHRDDPDIGGAGYTRKPHYIHPESRVGKGLNPERVSGNDGEKTAFAVMKRNAAHRSEKSLRGHQETAGRNDNNRSCSMCGAHAARQFLGETHEYKNI